MSHESQSVLARIMHELSQCDDVKLDQPPENIICELQKDRERLRGELADCKIAYGKLFNENAALQGRNEDLAERIGELISGDL